MVIINAKQMARVYYGLEKHEEPTHSQMNMIHKLAREGCFTSAVKKGRKWFFDLDKEFG